jgi:energy-coupling factor transporter transmembrane protein EcfT
MGFFTFGISFSGSLMGRVEFKMPTVSMPSILSFLVILSLFLFVTIIFSFSDWDVGAVITISEAIPVKGLAGTKFIGRIQPEA